MTALSSISDPRFLPYGLYACENSFVLHDRKYRPLMRFAAHEDQDEMCDDLPGGIECEASHTWVRVKPETAEVVAPDEWIYHDKESHLWLHSGSPDRTKLQALIDQFPQLGVEIERRDAEATGAKKAEANDRDFHDRMNADYHDRMEVIRTKPPLAVTESDLRQLPIRERLRLETEIMMARANSAMLAQAQFAAQMRAGRIPYPSAPSADPMQSGFKIKLGPNLLGRKRK
jgi:hypothetical protein